MVNELVPNIYRAPLSYVVWNCQVAFDTVSMLNKRFVHLLTGEDARTREVTKREEEHFPEWLSGEYKTFKEE